MKNSKINCDLSGLSQIQVLSALLWGLRQHGTDPIILSCYLKQHLLTRSSHSLARKMPYQLPSQWTQASNFNTWITRSNHEELNQISKLPYRSLVSCLLYLSIGTCPEISYSIQQLSQFLDCYTYAHWNVALRVVCYLSGTQNHKLHLGGNNPISLLGFTTPTEPIVQTLGEVLEDMHIPLDQGLFPGRLGNRRQSPLHHARQNTSPHSKLAKKQFGSTHFLMQQVIN